MNSYPESRTESRSDPDQAYHRVRSQVIRILLQVARAASKVTTPWEEHLVALRQEAIRIRTTSKRLASRVRMRPGIETSRPFVGHPSATVASSLISLRQGLAWPSKGLFLNHPKHLGRQASHDDCV